MPVRVDNAYGFSSHSCFDCDVLTELKNISEDLNIDLNVDMTDICLSPCEDIWKKFDDCLLTPPQSPPIKLDLVSDQLDFSCIDSLEISDNSLLHNVDVLHDCMWSGQCAEHQNTTNQCLNHSANCSSNPIRICGRNRPDTPMNLLSTSPFQMNTTFNDLMISSMSEHSFDDEDIDDSMSSMDDEDFNSSGETSSQSSSSSTSFAKVKESLINDHSYGGSLVISHQNTTKSKNSYETQSLIYPKHKIQSRTPNKIKCHKINGKKIKIIKANSTISCSTISEPKETTNAAERPLVVPTVRIIRNEKHFIKSKSCVEQQKTTDSQQKSYKFSTRRKSSTVSSERKVMLAQSHQQFLSKPKTTPTTNDRLSHSDDEDMKSSKVPPLRRREHNDSERKRRDHLRNAFINLKDQIPKLKSAEKRPPRIMILHEATNFVCHLNDKQRYLERTLNAEIEKREKLLKILSQEIKTESK